MGDRATAVEKPVVAGWRFKLGVALFVISLGGPFVLIPLVTVLGFSATLTATLSGGILAGAELLLVAAAAVMGKSGFAYLKTRVFGFLKEYGPPKEVSRPRYMVGLVLFCLPIVFGWLTPYAADVVPGLQSNLFTFALIGDVLLVIGLILLGGDFWDKLRGLFIHEAKTVLPELNTSTGPTG